MGLIFNPDFFKLTNLTLVSSLLDNVNWLSSNGNSSISSLEQYDDYYSYDFDYDY